MCKLIVAAAMLVVIPAFFLQAQAASPGPGSISQSTAKADSPIETTRALVGASAVLAVVLGPLFAAGGGGD